MDLKRLFSSAAMAVTASAPFYSPATAQELTRTQEAAYLPRDPLAGLTAYAPARLADVVSTAYAQGAQFVILGETDHRSRGLGRAFYSPAVINAAAESGVTDIYLEYMPRQQKWADALIDGTITDEEFANNLLAERHLSGLSVADGFDMLTTTMAPALRLAARYGIKTHFVDREVEIERISPVHAAENFRDSTDPLWRIQNRDAFNEMIWSVEDAQHDINWAARFDADQELGQRIGDIAQGRKGLIIYGSHHGSHFNDLDEYLPGPTIKIDVYPHYAPLNGFTLSFQESPHDPRHYFNNDKDADPDVRRMGEDKPELVFILSDAIQGQGRVYQTVNTPPSLKEALAPLHFIADETGLDILEQARQHGKLPSMPLSWK